MWQEEATVEMENRKGTLERRNLITKGFCEMLDREHTGDVKMKSTFKGLDVLNTLKCAIFHGLLHLIANKRHNQTL